MLLNGTWLLPVSLQTINETFSSQTGVTTNAPGVVAPTAKTQIKVLSCATTQTRSECSFTSFYYVNII